MSIDHSSYGYIDGAISLAKCMTLVFWPPSAPPATSPTALATFHAFHHQTQAPFRLIDIHQSSYSWMVHAQEEFLGNWWSAQWWFGYDSPKNPSMPCMGPGHPRMTMAIFQTRRRKCRLQMRPNGNFVLQLFLCLCPQVSPPKKMNDKRQKPMCKIMENNNAAKRYGYMGVS
jgi:hypothetical protein